MGIFTRTVAMQELTHSQDERLEASYILPTEWLFGIPNSDIHPLSSFTGLTSTRAQHQVLEVKIQTFIKQIIII